MRIAPTRLALATTMALAIAGCYRPELARCKVTCTDFCPGAQACLADGYCHADDDPQLCAATASDAMQPSLAIQALSAGFLHACAIDAATHLQCWGDNRALQIGVGSAVRREQHPTQINGPGGGTGWTAVAAGDGHTCAIQAGNLVCWGDDTMGQSGGLDRTVVETPTIADGSGTGWIAVAAGSRYTCGIRVSGPVHDLLCWGVDNDSQLGDGDGDSTGPTERLANLTDEGPFTDWAEVSAGFNHVCARRASGQLYCWGSGDGGMLGDGATGEQRRPTRVHESMDDHEQLFRMVSAGGRTTCAVSAAGKLYCWGNGYNLLGIEGLGETTTPRLVGTATDWSSVSVGIISACGTRSTGVYCWGSGESGNLGDGHWEARATPRHVTGLTEPALVAVGAHYACAAPASGGMQCWGDNANGELGNGNTSTQYVPTLLRPSDGHWTAIAAGAYHTCGIHDGEILCWGWDDSGELDGVVGEGVTVPTRVVINAGAGETAREIAVGVRSSCARFAGAGDGQLWCWGFNSDGQVGTGALGEHRPPTAIGVPGPWSRIAVSGRSASALIGGSRQVWGDASGYGLGNGQGAGQVLEPTATADGIAWKSVSMGYQFGCGLTETTHVLQCWGSDDYGEQGNGAMPMRTMAPHELLPQVAFGSVGAAWDGDHACATTTAGALYCWGRNDYLQAGTTAGGGVPIDTPTVVPLSGTGWTSVVAGSLHTCGLKGAGELYCWGNDAYAQLGLDEERDADATTRIGMETGWTQLSAGEWHTCGIRAGNAYCWGTGPHGQIGDGNAAQPVPGPVIPRP